MRQPVRGHRHARRHGNAAQSLSAFGPGADARLTRRRSRASAWPVDYNLLDSLLALNGAFFVNAAILILAAAKFHGQEIETLQEAHRLLPDKMGTGLASALFAIALLASGQSSTLTGTLAGQVVMEGFLQIPAAPVGPALADAVGGALAGHAGHHDLAQHRRCRHTGGID